MGQQVSGQQGTQVFYDANSGQYYTQSAPQSNNPFALMFGQTFGKKLGDKNRNYLTNFNSSANNAESTPYNYVDIAALFPQLSQAATGVQASSLLGDATQDTTTGEAKGAAKAASSGAGRFL
jgi:hypothetical protein